jgi:anaerobic ribonucleoside-triphosphate reductase activating protein
MSMPPDELTGRIRSYLKNDPKPDGITISGGEPFDQPDALRWIISAVHASGLDDVLIYSGYGWPEIAERFPWITDHPAAIVDGPFELGTPTGEGWKGSENQSLVLLGEHLKERYAAWTSGETRRMQYVARADGKFLIGIPRQGDAEVFRQLR